MSRHRVLSFDEKPGILRRRIETWLKTLAGFLTMGGLIYAALWLFNFSFEFKLGFWIVYPLLTVVGWWFSAKISLYVMKCTPADPNNPRDARLLAIVDRVFAKTGLKYKPPVYISDNPLPNAFATGPIHSKAVVAATAGLFDCGMTDEEIEAVFAHELGHVYNYDVGINSLISIMSSFFFLVVDSGVRAWVATLEWFKRLIGMRPQTRVLPAILSNLLMYVIFWATQQLTKLIQMFVVRSRESGADATGAHFTGNPCALASGLLKLVAYVEKHRPKGRDAEAYRVMRVCMTVDPIFDSVTAEPAPKSLWDRLKAFWKYLQLTHPPVPERVYQLERMNGGPCPLPKV
ncbi:MAG: M48 family metalloprotease [Candidatus Obscuribacterales bacterium]|nr:M48 family metalloprotease [Candidatus Obscuribacterales bacterium]